MNERIRPAPPSTRSVQLSFTSTRQLSVQSKPVLSGRPSTAGPDRSSVPRALYGCFESVECWAGLVWRVRRRPDRLQRRAYRCCASSPCPVVALTTANCAQNTQKLAGPAGSSGSSYDPKYGVKASPRLYNEGDTIPKGGGRRFSGKALRGGGPHLRAPRRCQGLCPRGTGLLVRQRVPRPDDRQWRGIRPSLHRSRPPDAAPARATSGSPTSPTAIR